MSRILKPAFASFTLAFLAAAWWGCSAGSPSTGTTTSSGGGTAGAAGSGGTGGMDIHIDGGPDGNEDDSGPCVATSAAAQHIHLDIVFLIDESGSMSGPKWTGLTQALTTFFNDPAQTGIGAGMVFFPTQHTQYDCDPTHYENLTVPIDVLPPHAFDLINAIPADATGVGTTTWGALQGALKTATAYQDSHPTHKVILVLATDGDPNGCAGATIDQIALEAKSALNYNGVQTYVIGVPGATIPNLTKIALAGGTTAAYDATTDISQFSQKMIDIRNVALGCQFDIPPPPPNEVLDPGKVNFSYTPQGMGNPTILPQASDLSDCMAKPGWYYDNNKAPTKIILCPASCSTVQADAFAKVNVLFGCNTIVN